METTGQKRIKISVFKRTKDSWYPSYLIRNDYIPREEETSLVEVSFIHLITGEWRVCAWGSDDMGLERDYPEDEMMFAWSVFQIIIKMEYVSQEFLINTLKFVGA